MSLSAASEPLAYFNGKFLPARELAIPIHDAGFVMGATVTDLVRTFHHRLFRLADHLARFRQSCERARIPQPVPDDELTRIAERLVEQNASSLPAEADLALVLLATPGPVGWYGGLPGSAGDGPPSLGMHSFPLPFARYRKLFTEGAHLAVSSVRHAPMDTLDPRIKMRSRIFWWIADREVQEREPGASALLLDHDGLVTETAAANLLVVQGGVVRTPSRYRVLNGVSLNVVEELCRELRIPFEERPLEIVDCQTAEEAMLSCTSYCLAPVRRIDGFDLRCPGPVFERLLQKWSEQVGLDIRNQVIAG